MTASRLVQTAGTGNVAPSVRTKVQVWDRFVRFFHWSLVFILERQNWKTRTPCLARLLHNLFGTNPPNVGHVWIASRPLQ